MVPLFYNARHSFSRQVIGYTVRNEQQSLRDTRIECERVQGWFGNDRTTRLVQVGYAATRILYICIAKCSTHHMISLDARYKRGQAVHGNAEQRGHWHQ